MGKLTEAQAQAKNKYNSKFENISVQLPKGTKERINYTNKSVNAYIKMAVLEQLQRDGVPILDQDDPDFDIFAF